MLQALGLHRTDDVQTDGSGAGSADLQEKKEPPHPIKRDSQTPRDGAEHRSKMPKERLCAGTLRCEGCELGSLKARRGRALLLRRRNAERRFKATRLIRKGAQDGSQQCSALQPAGSVGDVIRGEDVAKRVDL